MEPTTQTQRDGVLRDYPAPGQSGLPRAYMPQRSLGLGAWQSIDIASAQDKLLEILGFETFQSLRSILVAQQLEYRCQLHIYQWLLLQQSILDAEVSSTGAWSMRYSCSFLFRGWSVPSSCGLPHWLSPREPSTFVRPTGILTAYV